MSSASLALPLRQTENYISARCSTLLVAFFALASACSVAMAQDCTHAEVVVSRSASSREGEAVRMLREEVEKRTGIPWTVVHDAAAAPVGCEVVIGLEAEIKDLLPAPLALQHLKPLPHAESYALQSLVWNRQQRIVISGRDERGVLFGAGALLRRMELSHGKARLVQPLALRAAPQKPIRGHQLGYRAKNNTYDAWNLAQFEQQIRDLAIFGTNTIQLIAPLSDDAPASPLFPAPAEETLLGISRLLDQYGLNCSLYYPEMEADYAHPEAVQRELNRFEYLVRRMPRVDEIWVPGGDPGHTAPELLIPLVQRQAAILRRYHPDARVYISAQGMDAVFYRLLQQTPAWLNGVFFGPQSRDSFEKQRASLPAKLPLIFYPDIAHTLHAQFPVDRWDPVFALTEGREPVDPRPEDEQLIYRHFSALQEGFITYSEGVNDDVNKMLWSQWGWDESLPAASILQDYARYFIGPDEAHRFAQALADLEQDWRGPIAHNIQIPHTLQLFGAMEAAHPELAGNWRFQMALYRAVYDEYLQERYAVESGSQRMALEELRRMRPGQAADVLRSANAALAAPLPQHVVSLRERALQTGGVLFHLIGLQLSTRLYGASNWERGANLDRIDLPLNDRVWLQREFQRIKALPIQEQASELTKLLAVYDPPADGFKDDLGSPTNEPHLERGTQYVTDPEMYRHAIDGVSDHTPLEGWRWAELTYAEALYETPLALRYQHLDPTRTYRARIVYAGEDYSLPLRLVANGGIELQPYTQRTSNPQVVELDIPRAATHSGKLQLEWFRPAGLGGSGRGRQVAEVVLYPVTVRSR